MAALKPTVDASRRLSPLGNADSSRLLPDASAAQGTQSLGLHWAVYGGGFCRDPLLVGVSREITRKTGLVLCAIKRTGKHHL